MIAEPFLWRRRKVHFCNQGKTLLPVIVFPSNRSSNNTSTKTNGSNPIIIIPTTGNLSAFMVPSLKSKRAKKCIFTFKKDLFR